MISQALLERAKARFLQSIKLRVWKLYTAEPWELEAMMQHVRQVFDDRLPLVPLLVGCDG